MKQKIKKRNRLKVLLISLTAIMMITIIATIGVGNYFINYALVPSGAGGEREVEIASANIDNSLAALIDDNRKKADKIVEEWKASVSTEDVSVSANDGTTLRGVHYLSEKKSNKWVIVAHGYHSSPDGVFYAGKNFYEEGYNVLAISMRAHADSDGDYIGMGWLDRLDLINWIDFIIDEESDAEIVLYGISMGGATVMMASGEELPDNVKVIVEDCGYTSVWDIFSSELELRFGISEFPVLYMVDIVANHKVGYKFKEASALKQVKKSTTPILFIHGDADDFVPVDMVYELYDAASSDKEIYIVEGASHGEAQYVNQEEYYNKIFSFVGRYME
ncbi:MAG: alpha/beta hydrolase [Eubacteriales bacterium]